MQLPSEKKHESTLDDRSSIHLCDHHKLKHETSVLQVYVYILFFLGDEQVYILYEPHQKSGAAHMHIYIWHKEPKAVFLPRRSGPGPGPGPVQLVQVEFPPLCDSACRPPDTVAARPPSRTATAAVAKRSVPFRQGFARELPVAVRLNSVAGLIRCREKNTAE